MKLSNRVGYVAKLKSTIKDALTLLYFLKSNNEKDYKEQLIFEKIIDKFLISRNLLLISYSH